MTAFGQEQTRTVALGTRMFVASTLPWECAHAETIEFSGLGRTWKTCGSCGFVVDPNARDLLLRLMRGS